MRFRMAVLLGLSALAISSVAFPQTAKYSPPRLPDGHPDLQGTYDLATITPVERTAGTPFVLTTSRL